MTSNKPEIQKNVPQWITITGAVIGIMTLLFFMLLILLVVIWNMNITEAKPLITIVLAFSAAISTSFIGGAAAAKGNIPIPFTENHPITFSTTGGIAVFFLILMIGNTIYPEGRIQSSEKEAKKYTIYLQYNDKKNIKEVDKLKGYLESKGFTVIRSHKEENINKIMDIRYYYDKDEKGAKILQDKINDYFASKPEIKDNFKKISQLSLEKYPNAKERNIELWIYF